MAGKRIEWLDIAKGVGILLVIAGHCIPLSSPLCQWIFQFHMPLFFALSGYTFSEADGFVTTLKKKAKALLLPFLGYFLLGLAVTLIVPDWRRTFTLQGLKADVILANPESVHNSSIWFLVCLFLLVMAFWLIKKLPVILQAIIIILAFAAAVWYSKVRFIYPVLGYQRLPLNLDCVPTGLVFYALGHYVRKSRLAEKVTVSAFYETLTAVFGLLASLVVLYFNGYVNTHGLTYNNPILFILGGVFGTLAVFGLSALLSRIKNGLPAYCKGVLLWYGQNSLAVLGLQSLLIRLYAHIVGTVLGQALTLYGFPYIHAGTSCVLVAFVLCPLLILAKNGIKKACCKAVLKKG